MGKTWGIPSLRLGYLISAQANIRSISSVRGPYDVNQLAKVAVEAALSKPQYMRDFVKELNEIAKPKFERFLRSRNIVFWPSSANYIFCYFDEPSKLEAELRAKGILVRPKKDEKGIAGLRVTIGTSEQTDHLIAVLDEILPSPSEMAAKRQKV